MEKTLYFETFPLGTIAVSKIAAIIAYIAVFIELFDNGYWIIPIYTILYFLIYVYNVKLRETTCAYYRRTIHSKTGKFFQRFPPKVESQADSSGSQGLIIISVLSYILLFIPGIFFIYLIFVMPLSHILLTACITLALYAVALIIPAVILKKKLTTGICEF